MKRTIESITRTAMLAVAFMLCATSAWAEGEPEILDDAYLWLDASTLTGSSGDEVSSWESRNAAGKTASTTGTKPTISSTQLDGKNVVDFGDPGSGKDLSFDRSTTIRTVFMVADVADNAKVFLLGDSSNYNFHRGTGKQYFYDYGTDALVSGTYRNGIKVDNPRGTTIPTGFGLITLAASADVAASRICQDRTQDGRNGGKKIAELIIFNKTLTETERCQVEEYLMEKWLGYCYRKASVSADTTWSALVWDKAKPDSVPDSQCTYTVNITDNATLDLDGATIAAQSIIFDIASDKTLTLNGTATITGANISVTGSGKLKLNTSNPGCAITVASGATMDITTVESVTCAIYNYGVVNTDGTVSLSSGSNTFNYGSTLNVKTGTTTLSTSNQGLKGDIYILAPATLVNSTSDSLTYNASQSQPTHAYVYGTLTMNQKWTVAQYNYIHLYSDATLNGSGNLHFNKNTGTVIVEEDGDYTIAAPFNTDGGTAKVEVKGSATLTLSNTPNNLKIEKAGTGTLKWSNKVLRALSGTGGTIEIDASSGNLGHTFTSSTFDGVLKLTGTSKQNNLVGSGSTRCFADNVRPELIADAMETYLSKDAYNGQTLYVRNLSGRSGAKLDARYTGGPISYTLDTLQERDTEYLGIFNNNSGDDRTFALNVTGNNVGGIHTLTLGGDNASTNTLTVSNYAKVKFSSGGKWSKGIVVVGNNGVLESQNSEEIAAKLKVEEGATLKFANGVPLAATAYDWSGVSNDGSVNIDLSAVAPSTTPVTLIARDVDVTEDKFTVRGAKTSATLSVEDGALKVTFANIWRNGAWDGTLVAGDDAVFYLSQNSTLTVSEALSLGTVTVVKESAGNVTLTISGEGALTTGGWMIPSGVTVNTSKSMSISGTISGDGVLNIPASTTVAMNDVTCYNKITVLGTLETSGTTTLSGSNEIDAGGRLNVLSGKTTMSFKQQYFGGLYSNAYITIDSGAELEFSSNDPIFYNGYAVVDVKGTLTLGSGVTIQLGTTTPINIYPGGVIGGAGTIYPGGNGERPNSTIKMFASGGDSSASATISCAIQMSNNSDIAKIIVEDGMTLLCSGSFSGSKAITKEGAGTLDLTANAPSVPLTIDGGKVVAAAVPTANVTINENGTFTLTNASWTGTADMFSGTGTLELLANSSDFSQYAAASTFSGKLKVVGNSTKIPYFNGTAPQYTNKPEFELSGYMTLTDQFAGEDKKFTVKNLVGAAGSRIDPYFNANAKSPRYVSTLQTRDTEFAGTFISENNATDRKTALYVYGQNETVHSLTLSGINTSYGPLKVDTYGKVVFTSGGSWLNGEVTVGANGCLESTNATAITKLALADGANIVFPTSTSMLTGITNLVFEAGSTTYISFPAGAPDSGTIIDWTSVGSAPAGTFVLEGAAAETHYLTPNPTGLVITKAPASVTYDDTGLTVPCWSVGYAKNLAYNAGDNLRYITILQSSPTSIAWFSNMKIRNLGGATISFTAVPEESTTGVLSEVDGVTTYTLVNKPIVYTWTGTDEGETAAWGVGSHRRWTTLGNWSYVNSSSVVKTATRFPQDGDTVVFSADKEPAKLESAAACARIEVNGSARIYADSTKTLTVSGDVVLRANGITLTLDKVTLSANSVTTDVEGKVIKWVEDGDTVTYSVVDPVAQIGDVKYGSLANAFESASTTVTNTVTLLANCSETAVTLSGKTVAFVEGSYSFATGSLTGDGTVIVSDATKGSAWTSARFAEGWTGTFVMNWTVASQNNNTQWILDNYGISGSTVEVVNDISAGYFKGITTYAPSVAPAVYFNGDVIISNGFKGDDQVTTFSCAGMKDGKTFNTRGNGSDHTYFEFTVLENFDGTINVKGYDHLTIGTIVVDNTPDYDTCLVKITKSANATLADLANIQVKVGAADPVTMPMVYDTVNTTSGLYRAAAKIGTTTYLTVQEALGVFSVSTDHNIILQVLDSTYVGDTTWVPLYGIVWDESSRSYSYAEAGIGGTKYATIGDAVANATSGDEIKLNKDVTADPVLPAGVSLNLGNHTLTGTVTAEAGYVPSKRIVDGKVVYTADPDTTGEEWTGAGDDTNWTNPDNWSLGFVPLATTPVTFSADATVTLDSNVTVAGVVVNGAVSITASAKSLNTSGNITGSGSLTLNDVCLASTTSGIIVAPAVTFKNDAEIAGSNPITINGNVTIDNSGISKIFKIWDATHVIAGTVSIYSGTIIQTGTSGNAGALTITGTTTFNGAFEKTGDGTLSLGAVTVAATSAPTITTGSITIGGAITVNDGVTFTIGGITLASGYSFCGGETATIVLPTPTAVTEYNFANDWTGTIELPSYSLGGEKFNNYGNTNSKVKINGYSGWLNWTELGSPRNKSQHNPTLDIVGSFSVTAWSGYDYTFNKVTGSGSMTFTQGSPNSITITTLEIPDSFNGVKVTNNANTAVNIGTLVLPSLPTCDQKILAIGGSGSVNIELSNIKVGNSALPAKYKLERRHAGEEEDGYYVYYYGTLFSVY